MVEPVTLRITSRSSKARGLGTSAIGSLSVYDSGPGTNRKTALTDSYTVLSIPHERLHLLTGGVRILLPIAARVGHILLSD